MESLDNANIDNYTESDKFTQKLETLQSQLPPILEDFKKYYVFYNKTPDYPEYQQMFQNIKSNLNTINSDLFTLSNDVQTNIDKINEYFVAIDVLIKRAKDKNSELKKALGIVEHKGNAASELIYDYKQIYDYGYLRNWGLFISIIIVGMTISKVYKGKVNSVATNMTTR
jgi:uncharacterized coiled-coil DUF342 family protein